MEKLKVIMEFKVLGDEISVTIENVDGTYGYDVFKDIVEGLMSIYNCLEDE